MAVMPPLTVRLEMYDSDGMEVPGYLEVDVNLFINMSRMSTIYKNTKIVTPEEPKKPSVTYKSYPVDLTIGDDGNETVIMAGGKSYPMNGLTKSDLEELQKFMTDPEKEGL